MDRHRVLIFISLIAIHLLRRINCQSRIVGGAETTIHNVPYLVQLRALDDGRLLCGGSLVTYLHVVSAAHCIAHMSPLNLVVVGGASTIYDIGVQRLVMDYLIHPEYDYTSGSSYDIVVYKLSSMILGDFIKPIPLCSRILKVGDHIQVSGWGSMYEQSPLTPVVRSVVVPVLARSECRARYLHVYGEGKISHTMFCAAILGQSDACQGDSGGPAIFKNELCGIVSWGRGCARPEFPGVYTSILAVKGFIIFAVKHM